MSKLQFATIAVCAVFVMLIVQAVNPNGETLTNPVAGLLTLTQTFLARSLGSLKLVPETATLTLIGISLVGLSLVTRKPRRG